MVLLNDLLESARIIAERGSAEVRLFSGGLFVGEAALRIHLPAVLAQQAPYIDQSIDSLRVEILKAAQWKWVYWLEPGLCLPGIAVLYEEGAEFPSSVRPATEFIHDRDPYFLDKKDMVRILLHVNWAAEVRLSDNWLKISHTVLREFEGLYDDLKAVRPLCRSHESILGPVSRDRLRVLVKMLSKSEPVTVTHDQFVQQMRRQGISSYRKYREVIFCISRAGLEGIILDHELASELPAHLQYSGLDPKGVYTALRLMLGGKQAQKPVRLNRRGVFLAQKAIKKFSNSYFRTDSSATVGGVKKKLKRLTGGEIVYLIDGDRSHFGMLLPMAEIVAAFGWRHNDDIVMGKSMIIHDDPLYTTGQGIGLPMRSKCLARFQVGDELYHVSFHAFSRFLERASPKAAELKRTGAHDVVNQRGYLMLMHELFRKSEPIRRLNGAMQVLKHKFVNASYRATEGWIWVILPDNTVITCYHRRNPYQSVFRRKAVNPNSTSL